MNPQHVLAVKTRLLRTIADPQSSKAETTAAARELREWEVKYPSEIKSPAAEPSESADAGPPPAKNKVGRKLKLTGERRQICLDTIRETGNLTAAAMACGVCLDTIRNERIRNPDFAAAIKQAEREGLAEIAAMIRHVLATELSALNIDQQIKLARLGDSFLRGKRAHRVRHRHEGSLKIDSRHTERREAVIQVLTTDPQYLDYLRTRAIEAAHESTRIPSDLGGSSHEHSGNGHINGHILPGANGHAHEPRPVEDGQTPSED